MTTGSDKKRYDFNNEDDCKELMLKARERCCTHPVDLKHFDKATRIIGRVVLHGPKDLLPMCESFLSELQRREAAMLVNGYFDKDGKCANPGSN